MKQIIFIAFVMICCPYVTNPVFSEEINVLPSIPDALFNAVESASAGDVLILADGGIYRNSEALPVIVPLTIKTADDAAVKATLVFSGGPGYVSNMIQANASLTLKNLVCNGQRGVTPYGSRWINRSSLSEGSKIEVDSCEVSRFQFLSTGGDLDTLIVKNCLFNGNIVRAGSWGGTWDFQRDAVKYVKIQNNTFMFCIFGPLLGSGWGNYISSTISDVIIDHNTIYNITGAYGPTTMFSRATNVQFTNNLYVNGTYRPHETFSKWYYNFPQITGYGDANEYWGVITHLGPDGMWMISLEMVDSAATVMDMQANNIYWTSAVTDMWASKGLEKPYIWSNETEAAIVDPDNAYFEEELTFNNAPAVPMFAIDSVAEHCAKGNADTAAYKGTTPYFGWEWWNPDASPIFDLRSRDSMDMAYDTTAVSYTSGTNGEPLGDLNWFPDKYAEWKTVTSLAEPVKTQPEIFRLMQNYPNPFNPGTTIRYTLTKTADVKLTVYNALGQKVKILLSGRMNVGAHSVEWDGTNMTGEQVASGVYYYKLETGEYAKTMKMLLVR